MSNNIRHQHIPPHEQSLNPAEQTIGHTWSVATSPLRHAGLTDLKWGPTAGQYVLYVHFRTASPKDRGYASPYMLCGLGGPDITHLGDFFGPVTANKGRDQRKKSHGGELPRARQYAGYFIGFDSMFTSLARVWHKSIDKVTKHRIKNIQFNMSVQTSWEHIVPRYTSEGGVGVPRTLKSLGPNLKT